METYRRDRSYLWNYRHGPQYGGPWPDLPRAAPTKDFFGFRVGSRVGVSAGLLLNSKWIECYSRLGFDILTYKTVRSAHRPCYPLPNWVFVDAPGGLDPRKDQILRVARRRPPRARDVTSAVCFGMPSMAPEVWRRDVRDAKKGLRRGQVLIVSVVGTPGEEGDGESLAGDFARCARWAVEAGADIVEANYSCPNVCTAEGSIYQDAGLSRLLSVAIREALPSTPFLVKAGYSGTPAALRALYRSVDGLADGVVLVNGISRRVRRRDGRAAFGRFERVGVLGRAIHPLAVENVREAVRFARAEGLAVRTVAVGGVMCEEDAGDFFSAGAAGVVLGGAPMLDPTLAARLKKKHPEW